MGLLVALCAHAPSARGQVLALHSPGPLTGNQNFSGNLGIDFVVNQPIEVTALGVFDSEQNGIDFAATLEVAIWERDDNGTPEDFSDDIGIDFLVSDFFFEGDGSTLDGVYRVRDLDNPITLEPGSYTINAFGYSAEEPLYNQFGNSANLTPMRNESNGAIRFVGVSRYGLQGPSTFPETIDGGPAARYFAGTFAYIPPENDAFLSIEVDRGDGGITLTNGTAAPVNLRGYSISSTVGALIPSQWTSIADTYDEDGDGSVDPNDPWTESTLPSSRTELSESENSGGNGATLSVGQSVDLGTSPWLRQPVEDLAFQYTLTDGTVVDGFVNFVGGSGAPFAIGDFNLDGAAYTLDDFVDGMLPNLVTSAGGLFQAEAYVRGDLDGDSDVDRGDFRIFKQNFVAAGGSAEALAAAAGVPEPSSVALAMLTLAMLLAARWRRGAVSRGILLAALVASFFWQSAPALHAQIIALDNPVFTGVQNFNGDLGMDFLVKDVEIDVVSLGAFDSGQDGWFSEITVDLWSRNDAGTPTDFTDDTGIEILATEVFGEFDLDPGELIGGSRFRDLATPVTLQPGSYTIAARGYGPNELLANAGFAGNPVSVINDSGGILEFVGGSRYGTNNGYPDTVDGGPANRYLAGTFAYEVEIDALSLEVNRSTGDVTLLNEGPTTFDIDFYEIKSTSGSLNPAGWNSLAEQGVAGWLQGGAASATSLAEANLVGSTVLATGATHSLGAAYNTTVDGQDLVFEYTTTSGITFPATIRYTMSDLLMGDYNASGQVEQADLDLVLLNWGAATPPVPAAWTNDLPQGTIDQAELDRVLLNWGNAAATVAPAGVPEPAAILQLAAIGLFVVGQFIARRARPSSLRT
jgi:hypothetical protein